MHTYVLDTRVNMLVGERGTVHDVWGYGLG